MTERHVQAAGKVQPLNPLEDLRKLLRKYAECDDIDAAVSLHHIISGTFRGPDSEQGDLKYNSTSVLRAKVCAGFFYRVGATINTKAEFNPLTEFPFEGDGGRHFRRHIEYAVYNIVRYEKAEVTVGDNKK